MNVLIDSKEPTGKVSQMQTPAKRVVTNKRCQDANPTAEKPVKLKQIRKKGEENTRLTITEDDPCNQYETIRSSSPKGSNRQFQVLVIISCLISIVALLLVVLMLSGKIGNECGCSAKEGQFPSKIIFQYP